MAYYANGYTVIANRVGTYSIHYSTDGTNFSNGSQIFHTSTYGGANSVAYGNGVWVLGGYTNNPTPRPTVAYSINNSPGGTYTAGNSYYTQVWYCNNVVFINNIFYMMGSNSSSSTILYYSLDGINWIANATLPINSIYCMSSNILTIMVI